VYTNFAKLDSFKFSSCRWMVVLNVDELFLLLNTFVFERFYYKNKLNQNKLILVKLIN